MTTGFSQDLAPFGVARILGTSALEMLVCAHVTNEQREALAKEVNEEPSGRTYATAGVTGTKLRGSEETASSAPLSCCDALSIEYGGEVKVSR
jgi:hypothetical protein